jgi:hypothetical protein
LCQGQLEQITEAKVEAVQVPSRQEELLARKLKDREMRAAKKRKKALEKIQAEANRVNSERFMQGYLGNRRIELLEKGVTPKGDGWISGNELYELASGFNFPLDYHYIT